MRPRWRKMLADLAGNPVRTFLIVLSIAVGLMAEGMIVILHHVIQSDMREGYAAINPANLYIQTPSVDDDFIRHLGRLANVRQAERYRVFELRVRTGSNQYKAIKLKAYPDIETSEINQVRLIQGRWPPGEHEIVLEANRWADTPYQVGDLVELKLEGGEIRQLRLVGIVQDQTIGADASGAGFFLAPIQGYITFDSLPRLNQPEVANYVVITAVEGVNDLPVLDQLASEIDTDFNRNGLVVISSLIRRSIDHPTAIYIEAMTAILYLLGFLVVFLSGFLIINTLTALLNQQLVQIGVMKTVGATRAQIVFLYLAFVLVISLIGLALSIPLANGVAYWEYNGLAPQLNFTPREFRMVPQALMILTVIALFVPQSAALIPVLRGTRLPIQQALSGVGGVGDQRPSRLTSWLSRLRGISRPTAISLRNTFRQRMRLALTLITLALGGAIFIGTFNMRASLENYIDRLSRYFIADVNLSFTELYRVEELRNAILRFPGVESVEAWATAQAELVVAGGRNETVILQGPPDDSLLVEPILISGRWLLPGDQNAIALSEVFLEQHPDVAVGDVIRLEIAGKPSDWTVVGFYQFAGKNIGLMAFTNYTSLARVTHRTNRSSDFRLVASKDGLSLADQEALAQDLENYLNSLGYKVKESRAGQWLIDRTSGGLDALTNFLLFLAMLMAVVGSIGLSGTMSLNVLERTREIGVMRAIGAADRDIMQIVLTEGVLIGMISWGISVAAAVPVSQALSRAIGNSVFGSPLPFEYVIEGPVIWFLAIVFFSILASFFPARNASRMTIREILAYE